VLKVLLGPDRDGCMVCRLVGELDGFTVGGFRDALAGLGPEPCLVIDTSAVTFVDSAGLGVLIGGIRRTKRARGRGHCQLQPA
jgi:anti-anti-sigma factor